MRSVEPYAVRFQPIANALKFEEACPLIERPVKDFMLSYAVASQRMLALTRGHLALTQLLCDEIVALKNQQPSSQRRLATLADVEAAVESALAHGSMLLKRELIDAVDGSCQCQVELIRRWFI
ncbi:hypothetical protein BH10CHL1_BH10CHL1_23490 [soil metagenome]